MSLPLSDQRSHSDLIAELYDRHAAGLFAYCFDQLGDKGTAADAVVAVLTSVPVVQPRRALLYALARREIARRDVTYFPPVVDFAIDPATALIERVIRDIRPHQREVLLLAAVCRLTPDELADVLDVAIDTAGQLIVSARNRFTQSLKTALYHARHAEYVPERVAEVYGALDVAPIEDILARLPWQRPPGDLRARLLALLPALDSAGATRPRTRLPVKQLWPTTPDWPLPLSDPDQTTSMSLIPVVSPDADPPAPVPGSPHGSAAGPATDPVTGLDRPAAKDRDPARSRRDGKSKHEATTEPIPRLQGSILAAMAEAKAFRPWSRKQQTPPAPAAPDEKPGRARRAAKPDRTERTPLAFPSFPAPVPGDVLDPPTSPIAPIIDEPGGSIADRSRTGGAPAPPAPDRAAPGHVAPLPASGPTARTSDATAEAAEDTNDVTSIKDAEDAKDFKDTDDAEAIASAEAPAADAPASPAASDEVPAGGAPTGDVPAGSAASTVGARGKRSRALLGPDAKHRWFARSSGPRRHGKFKPLKKGEHHFDWAWELVGLLLAIAIALTVFFSIPMIVTP